MFAKFLQFLLALLPFRTKLGKELQAEIDALLKKTETKVEVLKQEATIADIEKKVAEDINAVRAFADRHVALLSLEADAKITELKKVLPDVSKQLGG